MLVSFCGLATSLLTAIILWWVELRFGFAFYSWTFWFILPIGAGLSGFAAASGYYAGSRIFNQRPTRLLLLNSLLVSVATFFTIYYLSYITLEIEGKASATTFRLGSTSISRFDRLPWSFGSGRLMNSVVGGTG